MLLLNRAIYTDQEAMKSSEEHIGNLRVGLKVLVRFSPPLKLALFQT
jgi:hypothetical protein